MKTNSKKSADDNATIQLVNTRRPPFLGGLSTYIYCRIPREEPLPIDELTRRCADITRVQLDTELHYMERKGLVRICRET